MKAFFSLLIFAITTSYAVAGNLGSIDPTLPGQSTLTISCSYPVEREDGTVLAINEIAKVSFFVEKDGIGGFLPAGENTTECKQVYDLSQVADGDYAYAVTATDTNDRVSVLSTERLTLTLKRITSPKTPTGLTGALN